MTYKPIDEYTLEELTAMKPWEVCCAHVLWQQREWKLQPDLPAGGLPTAHGDTAPQLQELVNQSYIDTEKAGSSPEFRSWVLDNGKQLFPEEKHP